MTADLILTGGRVRTMGPALPFAEAVAIGGGRVLAVGSAADVAVMAGPGTVVHQLHGRAVMPGLIDSHTHGLWGACQALFEVFPGLGADLAQVLAGIAARVAEARQG